MMKVVEVSAPTLNAKSAFRMGHPAPSAGVEQRYDDAGAAILRA
jgi:hypothetical protein